MDEFLRLRISVCVLRSRVRRSACWSPHRTSSCSRPRWCPFSHPVPVIVFLFDLPERSALAARRRSDRATATEAAHGSLDKQTQPHRRRQQSNATQVSAWRSAAGSTAIREQTTAQQQQTADRPEMSWPRSTSLLWWRARLRSESPRILPFVVSCSGWWCQLRAVAGLPVEPRPSPLSVASARSSSFCMRGVPAQRSQWWSDSSEQRRAAAPASQSMSRDESAQAECGARALALALLCSEPPSHLPRRIVAVAGGCSRGCFCCQAACVAAGARRDSVLSLGCVAS